MTLKGQYVPQIDELVNSGVGLDTTSVEADLHIHLMQYI